MRRKQRAATSRVPSEQPGGYADLVRHNDAFVNFYQAQGIVPDGEWDRFLACLKQNLPTTFRITGCKNQANALLRLLEATYLRRLADVGVDSPACLPWYPERLAWQFNVSRKEIRKSEDLERFHNFLTSETESGNISRQETVSMIPPLALDVRPGHAVLDLCAAPGSKTAQLIELLQADERAVAEGVVVANDVDNKRCYMLVHQAKRLQSPCVVITNHDAGAMPNISLPGGKTLKFDRILCDVPCSGDGTLRKNPDIWQKWNVAHCLNFHCIQARILKRGLEMLKVGGRLAYSTCSFCPYEDESVVHHVLALCHGAVELVDVSARLPGLHFVQGLSHWKVMNRDLEEFKRPEDVPEKHRTQIKDFMFPPDPSVAPNFNLQRCMRILPHQQNTGGFFVAVLTKVAPLPWEQQDRKEEEEEEAPPPRKKSRKSTYREDPFIYLEADDRVWPDIRSAYDVAATFDPTLLLIRCVEGKRKTIYFTSRTVKDIVTGNAGSLKVINTGVRLFSRCDTKRLSPTEFRVTQEGLALLLPFLRARVVRVDRSDVVTLLAAPHHTPLDDISDAARQQLAKYQNGSLVLVYEDEAGGLSIPLCAWKGAASLRAYVSRSDKLHCLRLCGVDTAHLERKKTPGKDDAGAPPSGE